VASVNWIGASVFFTDDMFNFYTLLITQPQDDFGCSYVYMLSFHSDYLLHNDKVCNIVQ